MKYDDKAIKCPFFISENTNAIKCEGVICSQQLNIFSSASGKAKYKHNYCINRYGDCELFNIVDEKYKKFLIFFVIALPFFKSNKVKLERMRL